MGRNYDFKNDISAMLVYCTPKGGYKSVGFAALDNVSANVPDESLKKKLTALTASFICLDGMNEKDVSIAVLTLDSEPVFQNTGKPVIATTLAIHLVLDCAASTEEAIELLRGYDILSKETSYTVNTVWEGLQAAQQLPNPEDVTSNTQWSIVYNDTDLTAQIVLRRHWADITEYNLTTNTVQNIIQ